MIVVDASVAVKWLLPEPGDAEARVLLTGHDELFAPSLVQIEVVGGVLRKYREGQLLDDELTDVLKTWERILSEGMLQLIPFETCLDAAVRLSIDCAHSLQDCLYLAAGQQLDAGIVTADRAQHDRGKRAYPRITLLAGSSPH